MERGDRWAVVVQEAYRGFTSYLPGLWEKEGLIVSALILIIPFLLLREFDKFFPFFSKKDQPVGEPG